LSASIFDLISEQAKLQPENTAVVARGRKKVSYSALRSHINQTVEELNHYGIGRNTAVAVVLPNGPDMAITCLAVMAGATCAPLNPEYKEDEFAFFLKDLDASLLITRAGMKTHARSAAARLGIPVAEITIDDNAPAALGALKLDIEPAATVTGGFARPDDVALMLHTSGTTSTPKLVPLTHSNICTTAGNIGKAMPLGADDVCLNIMPMFHIGGLVDLLITPLAAGGSVICAGNFSAPDMTYYLEKFKPTWCQLVPIMLQEILQYSGHQEDLFLRNGNFRCLRVVAAALPASLQKEFEQTFKVPVLEVYGMTETTTLIATNYLPPAKRKPGSVGLPAGPEVAVLDDTGSFLPAESVGEIVVRGPSIMKGYKNLEEENNNFFTGDWFHTGDMGHLDQDGYLFITGRIKEIINRGGEKISPQEVDEILLTHPGVLEAATFSLPHPTLGEEVAAAVVKKNGAQLDEKELIAFLSSQLAYFKIPRKLFFVDSIPKTANGKVQRTLLAETLADATVSIAKPLEGSAQDEIISPLHNLLSDMWKNALGLESIGNNDDFFDLGGDSLKAATFINELQEKTGEAIFVSSIFDAPTIKEFEQFIRQQHPAAAARLEGKEPGTQTNVPRKKIGANGLEKFRSDFVRLASNQSVETQKNPRAVFVLCPPRSGSTLLRAMLAGNNQLFAPPELYLLSFDTMATRKALFPSAQRGHLEGAIRAIMQATGKTAEAAKALSEEFEEQDLPVQKYYQKLQEWIGDRLLVDKTPFYCVHSETLERAELYFDNPLYIYLTRHPYGMIRSFEEVRMDQLWYPRMVGEDRAREEPNPYTSNEMGELVWLLTHKNITSFLKKIPSSRQYRISYEELVSQPDTWMQKLCGFLGVDFDPGMLEPQHETADRMTDGIHQASQMIGDVKFHKHRGISTDSAELWKQVYETDFLCDETWQLANTLGYSETAAQANNRIELEI
jgi:acyl-CoA synthetase (AMP-forming)/AMP-acid ligase II/LPS sulfotransferase NodH/acyl carrier protein